MVGRGIDSQLTLQIRQKRSQLKPHTLRPTQRAPAIGCGPPESSRGGHPPEVPLQESGGRADETLDKSGGLSIRRVRPPERLPRLVRFPEVPPVEEIDTAQVGLKRRPLIRAPRRVDIGPWSV
jgi:hypothetical protein